MFGVLSVFSQKVPNEETLAVEVSGIGSEIRRYEVLAKSDPELSITEHDEIIVPDNRGRSYIILSVSLVLELEVLFFVEVEEETWFILSIVVPFERFLTKSSDYITILEFNEYYNEGLFVDVFVEAGGVLSIKSVKKVSSGYSFIHLLQQNDKPLSVLRIMSIEDIPIKIL